MDTPPTASRRDTILLLARLLVWCAPLLVALVGWQLAGPFTLDVAAGAGPDVMRGFYAPEAGPSGAFRWSSAAAEILLPARPRPAILALRGAPAPDGTRVTLGLGDGAAVAIPPAEALVPRRYALLVPNAHDALGLMRVTIAADLPAQAADSRPLGLALSAVTLRPLTAGLRLPPPALLAALALLPMLLAVCLQAAGVGRDAARALAAALLVLGTLTWLARPLALQPLLLDAQASLGSPAVVRWLAALLALGLAGLPAAAFLLRTLPLRGLLFARAAGYVLVGWLSWYASAALRVPFGPASVAASALLLGGACCWALRRQGLRDVARAVRGSWRVLVAGEALFGAGFLFGLWLRWNGAAGPAASGTEKPMDMALLHGALRDPAFPPLDLWFAGHPVNYYYLGYVQVAAVARLAVVTPGEAFNLGMATLFGLAALSIAALVATICALDRGPKTEDRRLRTNERSGAAFVLGPQAGIAAAALLGVVLVLLAGNQMGALQLALGGSQARALDGGQLLEALWQRASGAEAIRLSRPTPPAPDFGAISGWAPAAGAEFDWWSPSRIVMDDLATVAGVERRPAITEFPFFSFFLGDLHAHVLALPHVLLIVALALAALARPTLPVYFLAPRGWLELALTGALLGGLYAVNAWDAPGAWLLFGGALALLYRRAGSALDRRSLLVHAALVALGLMAVAMAAAGPFIASYRSPFGGAGGPWEGLPLIGRALGPAPAHTGLHSFLAMFALFLLPLAALALRAGGGRRANDQRPATAGFRRWSLVLLPVALLVGLAAGFPLVALLPLALAFALEAWRDAGRPARALALWGGAVAALAVLAADTVYVRDQLEGTMSRYITVFKLYFHAWVIWGSLAAYAVWALVTRPRPSAQRPALGNKWLGPGLSSLVAGLFALLLAGALVYPVETLRRGERWAPPERAVDSLAPLARAAPDEAAAVAWLAANAAVGDVVLTAWCECAPDAVGQVAAASGVATLLGRSEGHQRLWRAGWQPWLDEIARRERDIPLIYGGDAGLASELLARYGVDFVYVGATERAAHGPALTPFDTFLEPAFAQGAVRIYRVR